MPIITFSTLYAEEIEPLDPEVVQSLYIESALFVAVFTLMSIVSIVISKKHAAQNLINDRKKREARKAEEELKKSNTEEPKENPRTTELLKMLKDGLITNEEFEILRKASSTAHTK